MIDYLYLNVYPFDGIKHAEYVKSRQFAHVPSAVHQQYLGTVAVYLLPDGGKFALTTDELHDYLSNLLKSI